MAQVRLFHHIQGLTPRVAAFADQLRAAGYIRRTRPTCSTRAPSAPWRRRSPTPGSWAIRLLDGRRTAPAEALPDELVYAGISLGVSAPRSGWPRRAPARRARCSTKPRYPITGEYAFGPWPGRGARSDPRQGRDDQFFAQRGRHRRCPRAWSPPSGPDRAQLFVYPGGQHLFVDRSLPTYDHRRRCAWSRTHAASSSPGCDRRATEGRARRLGLAAEGSRSRRCL